MEGGRQPFLFCLIRADRAAVLLAPLREHFAGDPRVAVLVEQRAPTGGQQPPPVGRGHQRAPVAERDPRRALPHELRREASSLRFVQRLEPLGRTYEDTDATEVIRMSRAKDLAAVSELWWRCSQRVHARLRPRLGGLATAAATPAVLGRVLDELERYDPERQSLTTWLDAVVDRYADDRAESRIDVDAFDAVSDPGRRLGGVSLTAARCDGPGDEERSGARSRFG